MRHIGLRKDLYDARTGTMKLVECYKTYCEKSISALTRHPRPSEDAFKANSSPNKVILSKTTVTSLLVCTLKFSWHDNEWAKSNMV